MNTHPSPNFAYLGHHDPRLVALATQAQEHFGGDPTVTLFKLRQFGEVLAQRAAAKVGLFVSTEGAATHRPALGAERHRSHPTEHQPREREVGPHLWAPHSPQ